jgi:hypothetical protein
MHCPRYEGRHVPRDFVVQRDHFVLHRAWHAAQREGPSVGSYLGSVRTAKENGQKLFVFER